MIGIDTAYDTLSRARDVCPDPLDAPSERQRMAARQRLREIDQLHAMLQQRQELIIT